MMSGTVTWSFHLLVGLAFGDHVPAELAGEDDQRAIEQSAFLQIENKLRDGSVDLALHVDSPLVSTFMGIPVAERNIFRGDFNEAGSGLRQAPRQQATEAETAGVVACVALLGLKRQIERLGGRRIHQAAGVLHGSNNGIALETAGLRQGAILRELPPQLATALKSLVPQFLQRPDGFGRVAGIDDHEWTVIGTQKSRSVECLHRRALRADFHVLSNVDKRRHLGVSRSQSARDNCSQKGHRYRLRRSVARVPVILMARVQDEPQVARLVERISVPRSITLAIFSRPSEILMLSTTVSMGLKVDRTSFEGVPDSYGV
jgi:hypothetical protein